MSRKKLVVLSFIDAALCGLNIGLFRWRGNPLNLVAAVISGTAAFYSAHSYIKICRLMARAEELMQKLEELHKLDKPDKN